MQPLIYCLNSHVIYARILMLTENNRDAGVNWTKSSEHKVLQVEPATALRLYIRQKGTASVGTQGCTCDSCCCGGRGA
jgi:hypothetical protein